MQVLAIDFGMNQGKEKRKPVWKSMCGSSLSHFNGKGIEGKLHIETNLIDGSIDSASKMARFFQVLLHFRMTARGLSYGVITWRDCFFFYFFFLSKEKGDTRHKIELSLKYSQFNERRSKINYISKWFSEAALSDSVKKNGQIPSGVVAIQNDERGFSYGLQHGDLAFVSYFAKEKENMRHKTKWFWIRSKCLNLIYVTGLKVGLEDWLSPLALSFRRPQPTNFFFVFWLSWKVTKMAYV